MHTCIKKDLETLVLTYTRVFEGVRAIREQNSFSTSFIPRRTTVVQCRAGGTNNDPCKLYSNAWLLSRVRREGEIIRLREGRWRESCWEEMRGGRGVKGECPLVGRSWESVWKLVMSRHTRLGVDMRINTRVKHGDRESHGLDVSLTLSSCLLWIRCISFFWHFRGFFIGNTSPEARLNCPKTRFKSLSRCPSVQGDVFKWLDLSDKMFKSELWFY